MFYQPQPLGVTLNCLCMEVSQLFNKSVPVIVHSYTKDFFKKMKSVHVLKLQKKVLSIAHMCYLEEWFPSPICGNIPDHHWTDRLNSQRWCEWQMWWWVRALVFSSEWILDMTQGLLNWYYKSRSGREKRFFFPYIFSCIVCVGTASQPPPPNNLGFTQLKDQCYKLSAPT